MRWTNQGGKPSPSEPDGLRTSERRRVVCFTVWVSSLSQQELQRLSVGLEWDCWWSCPPAPTLPVLWWGGCGWAQGARGPLPPTPTCPSSACFPAGSTQRRPGAGLCCCSLCRPVQPPAQAESGLCNAAARGNARPSNAPGPRPLAPSAADLNYDIFCQRHLPKNRCNF